VIAMKLDDAAFVDARMLGVGDRLFGAFARPLLAMASELAAWFRPALGAGGGFPDDSLRARANSRFRSSTNCRK